MTVVARVSNAAGAGVFRARRMRFAAAGVVCFGVVLASPAGAVPAAADPSPVLPSPPLPHPILPAPPGDIVAPGRDSTPAMPILSTRTVGAGLELSVASFVSAHACGVATRIRIDPSSSNATVARAAVEAAVATNTPIRATITGCAADGTPLTNSVWMVR